jgi:hypothetical protein
MSNLRLINETTFSSVNTVNVTDVFSADYDIYKITSDVAGQYGLLKFINSSGSVMSDGTYDTARLNLKLNTTFSETRIVGTNVGIYAFTESSGSGAGGNVLYIFNPFSSSSYTFVMAQTVDINSGTAYRIAKTIGVHKNTSSMGGFQLNALASVSGTMRTYGLRVDS